MDAAISDMQDDTRQTERQFDIEFGYDDEDPIERHVRLYLTPKKRRASKESADAKASTKNQEQEQAVEEADMLHVDVEMDASSASSAGPSMRREAMMVDLTSPVPTPAPAFRPGLLHFQRSSRGSLPSLTTSTPSFTRTVSSSSTPFGFDLERVVRCSDDTPGSSFSESSFEAIRTDDWASLYGSAGCERQRQQSMQAEPMDYFGTATYRQSTSTVGDRTSVGSTATVDAMASMAGSSKRPSLNRPRPRAFPSNAAPECLPRSREHTFRSDVADIREYSPEIRSRQNSADIYSSPTQSAGLYGIVTRSRSSSENSHISTLTSDSSVGTRLRSRHPSDDIKLAKLAALGLGPVPISEEDEEWMSGRTISETMVVQAGFRSQKGRGGVRVGR